MQILVLNGSPRPHGNTAAMVEAFRKGAEENGHVVTVVNVCQKKIAGCLALPYGFILQYNKDALFFHQASALFLHPVYQFP